MKKTVSVKTAVIASLVFIICICALFLIMQRQNNEKLNNILQINLDQIFRAAEKADRQLAAGDTAENEIYIAFAGDCFVPANTIRTIDSDKYDTTELYLFLLRLSVADTLEADDAEKARAILSAIIEGYDSVDWRNTEGLGKSGYYDFLSGDPQEVSAMVQSIEQAAAR